MSIVKDMSLAPSGQRKIDWVCSFMPALSQIEARFAREKPFSGSNTFRNICHGTYPIATE